VSTITDIITGIFLNCVVSVSGEISADGSSAVISYDIHNRTDQSIVLFNKLPSPGGGQDSVNINNVGVWPTQGGISVSKKIFNVPPNTLVESKFLPYLTIVPPGEKFSETITLSLPLNLWHPYREAFEAGIKNGTELRVFFELGLFAVPKGGEAAIVEGTNSAGAITYKYRAFDVEYQTVAKLGPLDMKLPVGSR